VRDKKLKQELKRRDKKPRKQLNLPEKPKRELKEKDRRLKRLPDF